MGRIVEKKLNKPILIAIVGKSASGKTYLMEEIINNFPDLMTPLVSTTTRPPRDKECEGKDYFFVSKEEFLERRKQNCFLEWTEFRNWYYGHEKTESDTDFVVGIFDPNGIKNIVVNHKREFSDIIIIYLEITFPVRLTRMIQRESKFKFEFIRRALADFWNFRGFYNFIYRQGCWILVLDDYYDDTARMNRIATMCSTVLHRRLRINNINDATRLWSRIG